MVVNMNSLRPRTEDVLILIMGSAVPGKQRNDSASLLDIYARRYASLNSGGGTLGQRVRIFRP